MELLGILKSKFNKRYGKNIYKSFPNNLRKDLTIVLSIIPKKTYNNISVGVSDETINYKLNDSSIEIPYRIYFVDISDSEYKQLNNVQKRILCCLYTRSCEGYIREKYLKKLLSSSLDEWSIPFIVKLCDEYVIEILKVIYDMLKDRNNDDVKEFCLRNKEAINRGYQRMISYWNEYYRDKEPDFRKYIGRKIFRECLGYDRSFEK